MPVAPALLEALPTDVAPVRVLIADDHELIRVGLSALFSAEPDLVVVGTACDGRAAVDLAAQELPDVVVMDLGMPVLDGIAATREILASSPRTRVLVLSCSVEHPVVASAVAAGACGYLVKHVSTLEVVDAVRRTFGGELVFSEGLPPWAAS
jgi:DNA-binding NarL/FixJ family response regulator